MDETDNWTIKLVKTLVLLVKNAVLYFAKKVTDS